MITVQDLSEPLVDQADGDLDRTVACDDGTGLSDALALTPTYTDLCDATITVVEQSITNTQTSD